MRGAQLDQLDLLVTEGKEVKEVNLEHLVAKEKEDQ